jgi:hypothetical protein
MNVVPNAALAAAFPADAELEHPVGCYLARRLQNLLPEVAQRVDPFDNWRDCGWVINYEVDLQRFEIYFSSSNGEAGSATWMLAIAPLGQPGVISRLFGTKPVSSGPQSKKLALCVHKVLASDPHVSALRWAMNADPTNSNVANPNDLGW